LSKQNILSVLNGEEEEEDENVEEEEEMEEEEEEEWRNGEVLADLREERVGKTKAICSLKDLREKREKESETNTFLIRKFCIGECFREFVLSCSFSLSFSLFLSLCPIH